MSQHDKRNAIRILHVVGGMNRGGVETWLMHVLWGVNRESNRFFIETGNGRLSTSLEIQRTGDR